MDAACQALPVTGVVGVVGGATPSRALRDLPDLRRLGLGGIEIRADLFPDSREALRCLREVASELPALFTVRKSSQGGSFQGSEDERIALFQAALAAGAAWIDVEWGTVAAQEMARLGAPLLVSHHDFRGTMDPGQLERLAAETADFPCRAVKVVPTARRLSDAISILKWIEGWKPGAPRRIAFAMGEYGFVSRVLSIARGSPIAYASLGPPVALGQVSAREFLEIYRPHLHTGTTRVLGVIGNPIRHSLSPHIHNPALKARGFDAIYLPILLDRFEEILPAIDALGIDGLSVTIPFKEEALRASDHADERSNAAGAANTLKVEPGPSGLRRAIRAFNTDVEGVLEPLRRRVGELRGIQAAVIGNGGAARGAVRALLEAGASPTLFYRNPERGAPVALSLGVPGRPLGALASGAQRVIINATPLGLELGDPSPISPSVFSPHTIAFEMVYDPPETQFLRDAKSAGATVIPGREMLVSQAVAQFRIFTAQRATYEELEANFDRGLALRASAS